MLLAVCPQQQVQVVLLLHPQASAEAWPSCWELCGYPSEVAKKTNKLPTQVKPLLCGRGVVGRSRMPLEISVGVRSGHMTAGYP